MNYSAFIEQFMNHIPEPEPFQPEDALTYAGIPKDAPYRDGALACIRQAFKKKGNPDAVRFWEMYQLSICMQLQRMETQTGKETVSDAIKTVKAVLYAMRNTE